jgi:hypothetical protein
MEILLIIMAIVHLVTVLVPLVLDLMTQIALLAAIAIIKWTKIQDYANHHVTRAMDIMLMIRVIVNLVTVLVPLVLDLITQIALLAAIAIIKWTKIQDYANLLAIPTTATF